MTEKQLHKHNYLRQQQILQYFGVAVQSVITLKKDKAVYSIEEALYDGTGGFSLRLRNAQTGETKVITDKNLIKKSTLPDDEHSIN